MLFMNLNKISIEISELDKDYQLWVCSHMTSENLEYGAFNVLIIIILHFILYYYFILFYFILRLGWDINIFLECSISCL